jgi:hypothetical protein
LTAADELGLRNLLAQFSEAPIDAAVIERAIEIRKSVRIKIPDALVGATALILRSAFGHSEHSRFQEHPRYLRARSCNNVDLQRGFVGGSPDPPAMSDRAFCFAGG